MQPHSPAADSTIIGLLITACAGIVTQVALTWLKNRKDSEDKQREREWLREEAERKARLNEHRHEEVVQKLEENTQITKRAATESTAVKQIVASGLAPTTVDTNVQTHAIREKVEEIAERQDDVSQK